MEHTKEPWIVADDDHFVEVMAGSKTVLPAIRKAEAAADFYRIVACVNACTGISNDVLEAGAIVESDKLYAADKALGAAIRQRDELLAAIETTLDENGHLADGDNCTLIALKRALAKVGAGGTAPECRRTLCGGDGRRGGARAAEDDDRGDDLRWPTADHVEHRHRRRGDAPHRRADGGRHDLLDAADADRDSGPLRADRGTPPAENPCMNAQTDSKLVAACQR